MRNEKIRTVALIAIFSALSTVLYHFPKFPLAVIIPFIPSFLDIQFSNLPAIIGGFILGPVGGILIVVIRALIKLPFTTTAGIGELADLMIGVAVVLTTSLIYRKNKTKKGGIIALISGSFAWVIAGALSNYFVLIPFYVKIYGVEAIMGMFSGLNSVMSVPLTESNFILMFVLIAATPFNIILSTLVSVITYFVYKRVSLLIKDL